MHAKHASIGAIGAIALFWLPSASEAAPLSPVAGELKATTGVSTGVEQAAYRRCWWKHGYYRVCRWYGYPEYYDDYGYYDSGPYYGYGPGVTFRFGGGHFHGHHFHGHHHH
jgi:hypothetical protein